MRENNLSEILLFSTVLSTTSCTCLYLEIIYYGGWFGWVLCHERSSVQNSK